MHAQERLIYDYPLVSYKFPTALGKCFHHLGRCRVRESEDFVRILGAQNLKKKKIIAAQKLKINTLKEMEISLEEFPPKLNIVGARKEIRASEQETA